MSEKRFIVENDNNEVSIKDKVKDNYPFALAYEHIDDADNLIQECLSLVGLLNEQAETIRKQSIRIYCQDKEVQRLLGQLEKIPKSIREVWLED